jgi:hypothetical protein
VRSSLTETTLSNPPASSRSTAASIARASRNGVVACSSTTTSARSPAASISRKAWATTGIRLAISPASSFGRVKGTSAPQFFATSATAASSVDTITRSTTLEARAASSVCARSGRSPRRLMLR